MPEQVLLLTWMRHVLVDLRFEKQGLCKQRTAIERVVQVTERKIGRHESICFKAFLVFFALCEWALGLSVTLWCKSTDKGQNKPPRQQRWFS